MHALTYNMSLTLRQFVRHLIVEGVLDSLKKRYADQGIDVDEIASHDPSPTKKYTPWMVKQLVVGANPNDVYPSIAFFHRHIAKFERKDINAYRTAKDLEDAVKDVDSRLGSSGGETSAKIVAEDGPLTLEWLETKQDAWRYTNSSRCCITQRSAHYFEQYTSGNTVFYVIRDRSKDPKSMDEGFAYAISIQRDVKNEPRKTQIWCQTDETIKPNSKMLSNAHRRLITIAIDDSKSKPKSIFARLKFKERVSDEEIEEMLKLHKNPEEIDAIAAYLPKKFLERFIAHEDPSFRLIAATFVNQKQLLQLIDDENAGVRTQVANRIDPSYLPQMMHDESASVRWNVANCIDPSYLSQMMHDENASVRWNVANHIDPSFLSKMLKDEDTHVRAYVAQHIDPSYLPQMLANEKNEDIKRTITVRMINVSRGFS